MMKAEFHNRRRSSEQLKITHRSSLVKEISNKSSVDVYDKKLLNRVLRHLKNMKRKKSKPAARESCPVEDSTEGRIDRQVKLRCRQLTNVVQELRKAIMRQDWNETATLLMILCHPGLKYYASIITRACFVLLYSHPKSDLSLLRAFVRSVTEYALEEDLNKFIRISFALKKEGLETVKNVVHARKYDHWKVTRDPEFDDL